MYIIVHFIEDLRTQISVALSIFSFFAIALGNAQAIIIGISFPFDYIISLQFLIPIILFVILAMDHFVIRENM